MPHTSYALLGAIRNHRITSPNVANHVESGHPNACNLCHLDKTLQWTSKHLTDWYSQPPGELDENQQTVAAAPQMMLTGDAGQRIVIDGGVLVQQRSANVDTYPPSRFPKLD